MLGILSRGAALSLLVSLVLPALSAAAEEGVEETVGVVDTRSGRWHLRDGGGRTLSFFYGNPGDVPLVGDWDCDGVDTPGMYRPSDGWVYLRNSNDQGTAHIQHFFGNPGDVPLVGDWDGDECDTLGVYRPSEGRFYLTNRLEPGRAEIVFTFGDPGDQPVTGDFDGDGDDEVGVYRPSTGRVYLSFELSGGQADADFYYGNPGDRVLSGDWDGDGQDTVGIFRPGNCTFHLGSANGPGAAAVSFEYGGSVMVPVSGAFRITGHDQRSFVCRPPTLSFGDRGSWVATLQERLAAAGFRPGTGGVFDGVMLQAVYAFQKYHGLPRDGIFRDGYWELLEDRPQVAHVPSAPDRVEIDISRQVLFLVRDHQVRTVLPVSTGNGELFRGATGSLVRAHTPRGWFTFQRSIEGWRVSYLGELWNPFYFYGGYAVHGSLSVPTYPASHGCVRVTMWDMNWLKHQVWLGMPVWVHD